MWLKYDPPWDYALFVVKTASLVFVKLLSNLKLELAHHAAKFKLAKVLNACGTLVLSHATSNVVGIAGSKGR